MPDPRIVTLTTPARVTLDPTPEQAEVITAACSVLTAAPAGPIPDIPPGEYRWTSEAICYTDVEASASTGRVILEAGGFGHRALPLPYQANLDTTAFGHDGAENVGRIDTLSAADGRVPASGYLTVSESGEGREYVLAVALGNVPGVSVDAAILDYAEIYETDDVGMIVDMVCLARRWEIMGVTGTPFPAFADARVTVEGVDTEQAFEEGEAMDDMDEMPEDEVVEEPVAASANGKITTTLNFDFTEAVEQARVVVASAEAEARTKRPPSSWFENPNLTRPTPLTIEADGRVYGHLAPWDSPSSKACHVGFSDRCVCAPRSPDGEYPFMASGEVICADGGKVQVATIAYLGGHVADDGTQSWTSIKAAYDDPGNSGLQVALGEDKHGIWMAGRVAPIRTAAEVEIMRACGVSGHWRNRLQGDRARGPRLIGACCVISEGFPKPVLTAAAGGEDLPAVAVGPVAVYDEDDELVALVASNGTARLAAMQAPATVADVEALRSDVAALAADNAAMRARLALLDPQVREAAASAMG